jgi:hypothetical protein
VIPQPAESPPAAASKPGPEATSSARPPSASERDPALADRIFWTQCKNAFLVTLLSLLIYFLLIIHIPALALWFAGVAGSGGILGLAALAWRVLSSKPLGPFVDQVTSRLARLIERPRVALFLFGIALIGLPGTFSDWYLHNRFLVVRIVPGLDLTDLLGDTGVPNQPVYEIAVSLGRKSKNGALQWAEEAHFFPLDASSISIGASKHYLRWRATRDLALAEKQARDLTGDDKVMALWKQNPVFLATRRLSVGDEIRISFRCRRNSLLIFQSPDEIVTSDKPNLKTIMLNPTPLDEFFQNAKQCATSP